MPDPGQWAGTGDSAIALAFDSDEDFIAVGSVQRKLRDDFDGAALKDPLWTYTPGAATPAPVLANSILTLGSGQGNADTQSLTSLFSFRVPFRLQAAFSLGARNADIDYFIEVGNAAYMAGAGGSGARWRFTAAVATAGETNVQNNGDLGAPVSRAILTTATYGIAEIDMTADEVYFAYRSADSALGVGANQYVHHRKIPDPDDGPYFIRFRTVNIGTPAASRLFNIDHVAVMDINELTVEITGGRGGVTAAQAVPAYITGGAGAPAWTLPRGTWYADTAAALGANGVFTGTGRDVFGGATATLQNLASGRVFNARAASDVNGTLFIDESQDNATWRQVASQAVVGDAAAPQVSNFPETL